MFPLTEIPDALLERVCVPSVIVLPLRYKSLNLYVADPKSYATSVFGIILCVTAAGLKIVGLSVKLL